MKIHRVFLIACFLSFGSISPSAAQSPLSGFNPSTLSEGPDQIFLEGSTFWGNNALPLRALFFDRWGGPFRPDEVNRSDNYWKTDAGFIYRGWRIAGFYRGELFLEANRDTVEILRMVNREQDLPVGRTFDIHLEGSGFSAAGIELSRGIRLDGISEGLTAGFTVRYLRGEKVQEGLIEGEVTATGPMTYNFDLFLDYFYDQNFIYHGRNTVSGAGDGYSFDAGVKYVLNEKFGAEVLFRDIGGKIYWKNVPYTVANATSAIKGYDEEGYQEYRPTIQGIESYDDFTQKIPLKTDIAFYLKEGVVTLIPVINFIEDRPLYWIDLEYKTAEKGVFTVGYNANYRVLSVGKSCKAFAVKIYLNDVDLYRVSAVGLTLSIWNDQS